MRIMAIDYGDARIGLAVSDLMGMICGDAWTLNEWNMDRAIETICAEAKIRDVGRFVLGLPKNMDGTEGVRAEKSREFADKLKAASGLKGCSGMSAAPASRPTPSSTPAARRRKSTARWWTPWRPALFWKAIWAVVRIDCARFKNGHTVVQLFFV